MTTRRPKGSPPQRPEAPSDAPLAPRPRPEPIGTVRRTLVRPDGTRVSVDVPVYPPFRLESGEEKPPPLAPLRRKRAGTKPRPTGSD